MANRYAERNLELETRAVEALRSMLKTDDDETLSIAIEGETNFKEAVSAVLNDMAEDEALADAIYKRTDQLRARWERLGARIAARRSAIERAMSIAELPKLELPEATLSLKKVPPKVEVYDESAVPPRFFDMKPVLNKADIKSYLAIGHEVPGARMSNGGQTLSVRRA